VCGVVVAARYLRDLLQVARAPEVVSLHAVDERLRLIGEDDSWRAGLSTYPARTSPHVLGEVRA